jgi:aspartate ammonia-lyase
MKKTIEKRHANCDRLALKISKVCQGEDLLDCAAAAACVSVYAILEVTRGNSVMREALLAAIFEFMNQLSRKAITREQATSSEPEAS